MKRFFIMCIFIFSSFLTLQNLEGWETSNQFEITETGPDTFQVVFSFDEVIITTNFRTIKYGDNFIYTMPEGQTLKYLAQNKSSTSRHPFGTQYHADHIWYYFPHSGTPTRDEGTYVYLNHYPETNSFDISYFREGYYNDNW